MTGNYQAALIANVALGFLAAAATWSIKVRPFEVPEVGRAREHAEPALSRGIGD
jgi:hypothetical protein